MPSRVISKQPTIEPPAPCPWALRELCFVLVAIKGLSTADTERHDKGRIGRQERDPAMPSFGKGKQSRSCREGKSVGNRAI